MKRIEELQDELFKKRANYVHLDRTLGMEKEVPYESWNIYTASIGHNFFKDKQEFIHFLERLVSDEMFYRTRNIQAIEERIESQKTHLRDAQDTLEILENDLRNAKSASLEGEIAKKEDA